MADDEQFSLCWNNFNSNLSAGFHESLCRGDLVDVTLAAEGQFVKAHRLVLSVCSPYFRKMFTQMPPNQHAFVFLKDVSHSALKDLIQFMYCGEVNVKQEALPAFISTAEALQIKGLTDSDPPAAQSPAAEPSTPTPQLQPISSPRVRQQRSMGSSRSYKIESVDEIIEDKPPQIVIQTTSAATPTAIAQQAQILQQSQPATQINNSVTTTHTVVTQKRPAQRTSISAPHIKRTKSTIDPLEVAESAVSTQQISVQSSVVPTPQQARNDTEYIDLPIELPTKSEPDYAEETGEVEGADNEATYVEDDSYGDMRYDESYFTEGEEGNAGSISESGAAATTSKAIVKQQQSSFTDTSYADAADQSNNDAQASGHVRKAAHKNATATETSPNSLLVNIGPPPPRKRGRPKIIRDVAPPESLVKRLTAAVQCNEGQPAVYASTTKGGMKVIYDGHHFRYSFRRGQYSIFQCCYKEGKEECPVKVVSDQKRIYPLEGEHVHFVQATDKSVTAIKFLSINAEDEDGDLRTGLQLYETEKQEEASDEDDYTQTTTEQADVNPTAANEFRENIKKRLQKALLGKKK